MLSSGRICIILLALALCYGCVTRTYTRNGRAGQTTEKRTIWIWQDGYDHP